MALDSKAHFSARLSALGLNELQKKFHEIGANTMGSFAFCANYIPGRPDDSNFLEEIVVPLTGDKKSKFKPQLRRLFFECYTAAGEDVNRRAAQGEEDAKPRKLPGPEREERFQALKEKLIGLRLEEELEPSTVLIDKYVDMEETGNLKIIKWEEFTKRSQEEEGIKKDPFWAEDNEGRLKRFLKPVEDLVKVSDHNLLSAKYSLQRRGLALNVAKLLSFEVHELLVNKYFDEMAAEVLPNHAPVSLEQVRLVDKEVFKRMAQETRGGFSKIILIDKGELPLDKIMKRVMNEHRVQALLSPYKIVTETKSAAHAAGSSSGEKRLADENSRLKNELKKMRSGNSNQK